MLKPKIALVILSTLVLLGSADGGNSFVRQNTTRRDTQNLNTRKFDEFWEVTVNDLRARLDNFAIEIQSEPNASGVLIVYASWKCSRPGEAIDLANYAREYLVNARAVDNERIRLINGGFRETRSYELWLVPQNHAGPTATPSIASKKARISKRCPRFPGTH